MTTISEQDAKTLSAAYGKARDAKMRAHAEAKRLQLKSAIASITEEDYQALVMSIMAALTDAWAFIDTTTRYADQHSGKRNEETTR